MKRAISRVGSAGAGGVLLAGLGLLLGLTSVAPVRAAAPPAQKSQASQKKAENRPRSAVKRRDPFRSLLVREEDLAAGRRLPPGKRGLVIAQLTVNGIVYTPRQKIAVVTMRGRNRAYFLRERDQVFNGHVEQITEDGVVFRGRAVDAFGNEYQKKVVKRVSGSGGER